MATAWHAKEAVRELYGHNDAELALQFVDRLADDMVDPLQPVEVRSLGRTLVRWRLQIAAWRTFNVSNGPTEAANNLIQAGETRRVRLHQLRQLPDQVAALCRQARLVADRYRHSALKRHSAFSKKVPTGQAAFSHLQPRVFQLRASGRPNIG